MILLLSFILRVVGHPLCLTFSDRGQHCGTHAIAFRAEFDDDIGASLGKFQVVVLLAIAVAVAFNVECVADQLRIFESRCRFLKLF